MNIVYSRHFNALGLRFVYQVIPRGWPLNTDTGGATLVVGRRLFGVGKDTAQLRYLLSWFDR